MRFRPPKFALRSIAAEDFPPVLDVDAVCRLDREPLAFAQLGTQRSQCAKVLFGDSLYRSLYHGACIPTCDFDLPYYRYPPLFVIVNLIAKTGFIARQKRFAAELRHAKCVAIEVCSAGNACPRRGLLLWSKTDAIQSSACIVAYETCLYVIAVKPLYRLIYDFALRCHTIP